MLMCPLAVCANDTYNDNVFQNEDSMCSVRWDLIAHPFRMDKNTGILSASSTIFLVTLYIRFNLLAFVNSLGITHF